MTGSVAVLAGADPAKAVVLGLAMTALQLGIGAVNDVIDAPRDAGRKPGKPIPAGLITSATGRSIAAVAFAVGIGLATVGGPIEVALAGVVAGIGLAYDLRLKGTAWSWLPFAVGIPLLPVFGWAGATGSLSPMFAVLIPAAMAGGAALAIANSLVDVERDRGAGVSSAAIALGEERGRSVAIALLAAIELAVVASAAASGRGAAAVAIVGAIGCVPLGAALLAGPADPTRREAAWRVEAVGLGVLAIAWIQLVAR